MKMLSNYGANNDFAVVCGLATNDFVAQSVIISYSSEEHTHKVCK